MYEYEERNHNFYTMENGLPYLFPSRNVSEAVLMSRIRIECSDSNESGETPA